MNAANTVSSARPTAASGRPISVPIAVLVFVAAPKICRPRPFVRHFVSPGRGLPARGIPEPVGGFPPDVAWHPGERALILAARLPTGDLTAVQLVRLTASGHKRQTAHLVKQTFGRLKTAAGQAFLTLPARADVGPDLLQLAEGPETGLSAWTATGAETWIAFGSGPAPQPGFFSIILADDDPPGSKRAIAFKKNQLDWTGPRPVWRPG